MPEATRVAACDAPCSSMAVAMLLYARSAARRLIVYVRCSARVAGGAAQDEGGEHVSERVLSGWLAEAEGVVPWSAVEMSEGRVVRARARALERSYSACGGYMV